MPEISEGDQVVTPEGEIKEVKKSNFGNLCVPGCRPNAPASDSVKLDEPIRVRVSRQCYAESLVALVEKVGFTSKPEQANYDVAYAEYDGNEYIFVLSPEEQKYWTDVGNDYDLTYRDDLPQIEAWLGYWSDKNE